MSSEKKGTPTIDETMETVEAMGPELVALFNRFENRAAVLFAIGGTLGASAHDKDDLLSGLSLLSTAALAEYKLKQEAAKRRAHADA